MTEDFSSWIGRSVELTDSVTAAPLGRLAATLDHDGAHWPKGTLPPLGHWLFHLPDARQSELGPDGHPFKGGFLPPIPQPRRMWAGGRLSFEAPIPIGAKLTKRSTVQAIEPKGAMTFVTVSHELLVEGNVAVREEQDIVYLPITAPAPPKPIERPAPEHERCVVADEALLFRFSALTFNAHRIHYDPVYASEVELYPALVVHGPLQAMLLADEVLRLGESVHSFAFRARAPLYCGRGFSLARAGNEWWIRDEAGTVTMTATIA